jgi:hypothetical protein
MAEVGGITELQMLQAEVTGLKKELTGVEAAEPTSVAAARAVSAIKAAEGKDGFLVKEGGTTTQNQFHTAAGPAGDDGCCTVL